MTPASSDPPDPVTRRLAEVVATARYEALPPAVVAEAERAVLDWLGSALAGSLEAPARMTQDLVAQFGQADNATVFSSGRSSAAGAALANGVASHILELDDVHKGSTLHPAAPVISAALAVAEAEHADGRGFLLAVVLGYEAALRIGEAVNPSHYRFWHPTGTAATFGAAVAAGSLLHLGPTPMLDALGTAGTQAAGLWEFNADGAMSKHLHPGKAAFNGVVSAQLARKGFTGATRILEGDRGFFHATSTSFDSTRMTDGLGVQWKILETCYKLHACCGHTHAAIDLAVDIARDLRGRGLEPPERVKRIRDIHILTYGPGYDIVQEPNPRSAYQAQFSIAYCVSAGLLEECVGLAQFDRARFDAQGVCEPDIAALLPRTRVTVDAGLTAKYPSAWPARVVVTFDDGTTLMRSADYPRGNPEHPVSTAALEDKFRTLVGDRFGTERAAKALALAHSVRGCGDVSTLIRDYAPWAALPHPAT